MGVTSHLEAVPRTATLLLGTPARSAMRRSRASAEIFSFRDSGGTGFRALDFETLRNRTPLTDWASRHGKACIEGSAGRSGASLPMTSLCSGPACSAPRFETKETAGSAFGLRCDGSVPPITVWIVGRRRDARPVAYAAAESPPSSARSKMTQKCPQARFLSGWVGWFDWKR